VAVLSVRRAGGDERDGAFSVWLAANGARGRFPSATREERVREKLADPVALLIVAVDEDSIVGMALGEPGRHADGDGPLDPTLVHVSMVFVRPGRWGEGVGSALLGELFAEARRLGRTRATVWTAVENERAYRLYARSNMHPTGRTRTLGSYGTVLQFGAALGAAGAAGGGAAELSLRTGGAADEGVLLTLFDEAVAWLVARGQTGQWGADPFSARLDMRERVNAIATSGGLWIAEHGDEPVGALALGTAPSYAPAADRPEVYVDLVLASRRFSGMGVGRSLVDLAVRVGRERGAEQLRVDCWADAEGLVRWYEEVGFVRSGTFDLSGWRGQLLTMELDARGA
jgi:GNAT superfamily N-acetyltransferase